MSTGTTDGIVKALLDRGDSLGVSAANRLENQRADIALLKDKLAERDRLLDAEARVARDLRLEVDRRNKRIAELLAAQTQRTGSEDADEAREVVERADAG